MFSFLSRLPLGAWCLPLWPLASGGKQTKGSVLAAGPTPLLVLQVSQGSTDPRSSGSGVDHLYAPTTRPGIRARLHSEAVTNRTWLSSYQIHRALISDPFSKPRQGSGLAYLDSYLFTFQYHQVERLRDQGWRGSLNATYPAFLYRTDPRSIV